MLAKREERLKAVALRQEGKSYSEILQHIKVSQSSLSLWLKHVSLSVSQKQRLHDRWQSGQSLGAAAKKQKRLQKQSLIYQNAAREIGKISRRELWLLGIIAYWCEGSKQKEHNVSERVCFTNSDPFLVKLFLKWLVKICRISLKDIDYYIHIHESGNIQLAISYWQEQINIPESNLPRVILKKHKISTNRHYTNDTYHGVLRISIQRSTDFNRKIVGWMLGIKEVI